MKILEKFGYPETLIKSYEYWNLLLRPNQSTFGALVLVAKSEVRHFPDLEVGAFSELKRITAQIENNLSKRFDFQKINYQMMMMVDPEVHFHILPRYDSHVVFSNIEFEDVFWPNPVDLSSNLDVSESVFEELKRVLLSDFNASEVNGSGKKFRKMYTSGCFDIFHQGHLNIVRKTKELCDYLVVGVSTDELIIKSKGRPPLIPFEERVSILEANKYVDEVIPQVDKDKQKIVDQYNIDAISVGSDWKGKYPPVTCEMVYFDYTPNVSSTVLKTKLGLKKGS